jgi:PBP1b-binding outer membrane lipoprotein LpoB
MGPHLRVAALLSALALAGCSCERDATQLSRHAPPNATDRLLPGEELPGRPRVFGIEVPEGMHVAARFPKLAQLDGQVKLDAVTNYFKNHVDADRVELGNGTATFPSATVKGDAERRVYRIEVVAKHGTTSVKMRDITPPPVVEGLSEKERWERAGLNPDGSLKDRLKAY